jgi:hypothetical protein
MQPDCHHARSRPARLSACGCPWGLSLFCMLCAFPLLFSKWDLPPHKTEIDAEKKKSLLVAAEELGWMDVIQCV